MLNISKNTIVSGIEKTGCKLSHIQHCLNARPLHSDPEYSFFGKTASRGIVSVHTKNGTFSIKFHEVNGWAKALEVI